MPSERYPLPFGWVKTQDKDSGVSFYVDTKATPPRSIWNHPYEDDEYLKAHPDVREKLNTNRHEGSDSNLPPPSFEESQRRHGGGPSHSSKPQPSGTPVAGSSKQDNRGPIGSLKDKVFGTKEERKAEKLRKKEKRAREEAERQQRIEQMNLARQQYYACQPQYGYAPGGFGHPSYGGGGGGFASNNRGYGGGIGLPLVGGLVGGLLLGEALGGFDDFGGFGGFDGGGGDFF